MARNLKYQFLNAINSNFKEGMQKHSIKKSGNMNGTRIFSYADRKNLIDLASNFSNYMKENYPNVKMVKNVTHEHIQGFLNSKANNCSTKTLEQYATKFNKLEKLVNVTYGTNANYKGYVVPTSKENTKIRNVSMSHEDFAKLQNSFANSSSSAKYAIELSGRCGLRVSECSKLQGRDIVLNGDNSYINVKNSKGGRSRQVPINKSDMAYFTELKEQFGDTTQRICPAQPNSINKAINRHMQQIGLDKKYKDTSIHSLRKMYAQDQFNNLREQGYSIQESMGKVSVLLGHSEDRETLMREYILDIK